MVTLTHLSQNFQKFLVFKNDSHHHPMHPTCLIALERVIRHRSCPSESLNVQKWPLLVTFGHFVKLCPGLTFFFPWRFGWFLQHPNQYRTSIWAKNYSPNVTLEHWKSGKSRVLQNYIFGIFAPNFESVQISPIDSDSTWEDGICPCPMTLGVGDYEREIWSQNVSKRFKNVLTNVLNEPLHKFLGRIFFLFKYVLVLYVLYMCMEYQANV